MIGQVQGTPRHTNRSQSAVDQGKSLLGIFQNLIMAFAKKETYDGCILIAPRADEKLYHHRRRYLLISEERIENKYRPKTNKRQSFMAINLSCKLHLTEFLYDCRLAREGYWSVSGLEIRQVNTGTGRRAWVIKLRNSLC